MVGGVNTITINLTDTGSYNGVRMEGTIQARTRASSSSSTGRLLTSSAPRRCPYWADGTYYPRCYCPLDSTGIFPYCDCPAPYKGEVPYDCEQLYPDPNNPNWQPDSTGGASAGSTGLSGTAIGLIVLAVVVVAAICVYGYWKYFRQPASSSSGGDNWHDKSNLLSQPNSDHVGHLSGSMNASHTAATQSGLGYYTGPADTVQSSHVQPTGQREGVELH